MKDLTRHYGNLKADERLKVAIDAMARRDWLEVERLGETCPKIKYVAQRDLAYTGKFTELQTIALIHAAVFWKCRGSMVAAMLMQDAGAYSRRYAELLAMIEAFDRFCEQAGFEAETVMLAFGLVLDLDIIDGQKESLSLTKR
jgi:hypothetical protein